MNAMPSISRREIHLCAAGHKQRGILGVDMIHRRKLFVDFAVLGVILLRRRKSGFPDREIDHGMLQHHGP